MTQFYPQHIYSKITVIHDLTWSKSVPSLLPFTRIFLYKYTITPARVRHKMPRIQHTAIRATAVDDNPSLSSSLPEDVEDVGV
mmetsp:Transcript_24614/g.36243  ORF Transcript_24614/g.36243 Transcript_24614/m.36243 type:complete len:83 (-) Transcript_24614:1285-1533(-)